MSQSLQHISSLSLEILDGVTNLIDGESLIRLWMTGDNALQGKLASSVTHAGFDFGIRRYATRVVPPVMSVFGKLRSFQWTLSSQDAQDPIPLSMFRLLPSSLRELELNRAVTLYSDPLQNGEGLPTRLSEMFPNLERLIVLKLPTQRQETIPRSITWLECEEGGGELSDELTTLIMRQIGNSVFSVLLASRPHPSFPKEVKTFLANSCANLTRFECHWCISTALDKPESWDILPRTLTSLLLSVSGVITEAHLARLPLGLERFSITQCAVHEDADLAEVFFTPNMASVLPRQLIDLSLHLGRTIYATLENGVVSKLPPSLTSLRASFASDFGDTTLDTLPLRTVVSTWASGLVIDQFSRVTWLKAEFLSFDCMPPSLVHLEAQVYRLALSAASHLSSLKYLLELDITEKYKSETLIEPFWPPSVVRLAVRSSGSRFQDELYGLAFINAPMADAWMGRFSPDMNSLELNGPVPVFDPQHLSRLPPTLETLEIPCSSSEGLQCLPKRIRHLIFGLPLLPLNGEHLRFLPPLCESVMFLGTCFPFVVGHFEHLPSRLGLMRLRSAPLPDDVKKITTDLQVRIILHHVQSCF